MLLPKFIHRFFKKRRMIDFYSKFIQPNDLCFDVGANIGERTELFYKLGAKVITFEPQNSCFVILQNKFSENKSITLLPFALGRVEKQDELLICDETNECSTLSQNFVSVYSNYSNLHWQKKEKIQVTTLDKVIEKYGLPKFIKLDVEGYESEVLAGLNLKVKYIAFEFNRPLISDTILCLEKLKEIGNCRCNFIKYEFMELALKDWMPIKEFTKNLTKLIGEDVLTGEIFIEFA